jgi:hypothetical protein
MAGAAAVQFVVTAKDAASRAIGNITKGLNKMGGAAKTARNGVVIAAGAMGALAAVGLAAAKAAADDERDTVRLNAALKARGFLTDDLSAAIARQTTELAALGVTDDAVRAGIEIGSRFFKDQATVLKANAVAADIAAVTGQDLAEVVTALGKGAKGQTRGLKLLGIEVKKGATAQDILTAASLKYSGAAAEIAKTSSGKFAAAQIRISEAFESLGYVILPVVSDALDVFTKDVLPAIESALSAIAPVVKQVVRSLFNALLPVIKGISQFIERSVVPALSSLGEYFTAASKATKDTAAELGQFVAPLVDIAKTLVTNLLPIVGTLAKFFTKTVLPAVRQVASAIITNLLPPLVRLGKFIAEQVAPRIAKLVAFLAEQLAPVVTTVANVLATTIIPVLGKLAGFIIDNVLPAILGIVDAISGPLGAAVSFISGVLSVLATIFGAIVEVIAKVVEVVSGPLSVAFSVIGAIFDVIGKVLGFIGDLFGQFIKMVTDSPLFKIVEGIGGIAGGIADFITGGDKPKPAPAGTSGGAMFPGLANVGRTAPVVAGASVGAMAGGAIPAPVTNVSVTLDGKNIATSVDKRLGQQARAFTPARSGAGR